MIRMHLTVYMAAKPGHHYPAQTIAARPVTRTLNSLLYVPSFTIIAQATRSSLPLPLSISLPPRDPSSLSFPQSSPVPHSPTHSTPRSDDTQNPC